MVAQALPHARRKERPEVAVDGLFTNDKFCLTRQGTLALFLPDAAGHVGAIEAAQSAGG
jgi:hypothetical protein